MTTARLHFRNIVIAALIGTCLYGCSMMQKRREHKAKEKERVELKKEHYGRLTQAIAQQQLREGATTDQVLAKYGEPDDVFRSGPSDSMMEVWTYNKVMDNPNELDWSPVRLYFNDRKLVTWRH